VLRACASCPVKFTDFFTAARGPIIERTRSLHRMHGTRKMNTLAHPLDPADATLTGMLSHFTLLEPVFDAMPDVVFFVKDAEARYALVNRTLASRCGYKDKTALLGKTAEDVFPRRFGRIYTAQDIAIINVGNQMVDQLELHLYPGRQPGWCLTCKQPLRDTAGRVVGLAGISRDLKADEGSPHTAGSPRSCSTFRTITCSR